MEFLADYCHLLAPVRKTRRGNNIVNNSLLVEQELVPTSRAAPILRTHLEGNHAWYTVWRNTKHSSLRNTLCGHRFRSKVTQHVLADLKPSNSNCQPGPTTRWPQSREQGRNVRTRLVLE